MGQDPLSSSSPPLEPRGCEAQGLCDVRKRAWSRQVARKAAKQAEQSIQKLPWTAGVCSGSLLYLPVPKMRLDESSSSRLLEGLLRALGKS